MAASRRWQLLGGALALLVVALVVYEWRRERPALVDPVASRPPGSVEETARLEGGFTWSASRGKEKLFELLAGALVGMQGGINFVRDVESLTVYTPDGQPVVVKAAHASIRQVGDQPDEVEVSLDGTVRVTVAGQGLALASDRLVFDARTRRIESPGAALVAGPGGRTRMAGFSLDPDSKQLEARGPVEFEATSGAPWRADATAASYAAATAELRIADPFRLRGPDATALLGPASLRLPAGGGGRVEADGPVLLQGRAGRAEWQLAAGRLQVEGIGRGGDGGTRVRRMRAERPASLLFRSAERGGFREGGLDSATWTADFAEGGALSRTVAGPGFGARGSEAPGVGASTTADRGPWTLAGEWLEIEHGADGAPAKAVARGAVRVGGPRGLQAEAQQLTWEARRADELLLAGEPARIRQGADGIEAPRLVVQRSARRVVAEGGVLTETAALRRSDSGLFRGDEPLRIKSVRATLVDGGGPARFDGPVQAWQLDTTLRARSLTVDRSAARMLAEGEVAVIMPVGDAAKGDLRRVRLVGQRLDYDNARRIAMLSGRALYEEPGVKVEADRMVARLDDAGGIEALDAEGTVKIDAQGNIAAADRLAWTGGREGLIELFGEEHLATLESPRQKLRAQKIRYDLRTRQAVADSGGGRLRIDGSTGDGSARPAPPKGQGEGP